MAGSTRRRWLAMARPKADLPAAEALRALADGEGRLAVRVTPGARGESIEIVGDRVLVKVRAKRQDGSANEAVIALVASALGQPRTSLRLLRGATSREKLLGIDRD